MRRLILGTLLAIGCAIVPIVWLPDEWSDIWTFVRERANGKG